MANEEMPPEEQIEEEAVELANNVEVPVPKFVIRGFIMFPRVRRKYSIDPGRAALPGRGYLLQEVAWYPGGIVNGTATPVP
ncbi:hypothetical protein HUJ04_012882 [Dendroctonus ponderosae]|nr:hypothetical protein HUJ04_012882 [Dendroctonus ponderosae]